MPTDQISGSDIADTTHWRYRPVPSYESRRQWNRRTRYETQNRNRITRAVSLQQTHDVPDDANVYDVEPS